MRFIKEVTISNFYSIKNEVKINFESSDYMIKNHIDRTLQFRNEHCSILNVIYGANASGKSSILKAIVTVANVITNNFDDKFPISFKNKFNKKKELSKIVINFIVDNEEYLYELVFMSLDFKNQEIRNEILYTINNKGEEELLFDRSKKTINNIDTNISKLVFKKLSKTKSIIYEFYKFDKSGKYDRILNFFQVIKHTTNITNAYITEIVPSKNKIESRIQYFLGDKDIHGLKKFLIKYLDSIGLDINDIIPTYEIKDSGEKVFDSLFIKHKISNKKQLELILESDGTMNLIQILVNTFICKNVHGILIIDEFDSILHPMLVPLLNKLLLDNNIQIIYTTHNIYNMKYLYHDEITFIEKDSEHLTTVKPLNKFNDINFTDNILDLYEEGIFGGIPNINSVYTKINS